MNIKSSFLLIFLLILNISCTSVKGPAIDDIVYIQKAGFLVHESDLYKWASNLGNDLLQGFAEGMVSGAVDMTGDPAAKVLYREQIASGMNKAERVNWFWERITNDSTSFLTCGQMYKYLEEALIDEVKKAKFISDIVPVYESELRSELFVEQLKNRPKNIRNHINSNYGIHGIMEVRDVSLHVESITPKIFQVYVKGKLILRRTDNHKVVCSTESLKSKDFALEEPRGREFNDFFLEDEGGETFRKDFKLECKILAQALVNNFSSLYQ